MKRIVVTGGSGKLGRACVQDLIEHGYDVINADIVAPKEIRCPFFKIDLENMAQVSELLAAMDFEHSRGVDAIVHLAAIPGPGSAPNETVFRVNSVSTYNVFEAARRFGIRNIVWASSETLLGLPFAEPPPYAPLDEESEPRPNTGYSLSKLMGEEMAKQFCRWDPELKVVGLRFSNVMEPSDYAAFPAFDNNPGGRRFNLWGYIDARDGAQAIRKALEASLKGAHVFIIANADTVLTRPNDELLAEFYPSVPVKRTVGPNETLLSIDKARSVLGYQPQHSWRTARS
ncbi:MAG: NAD(P)-dependent oxidoreductase [Terrimicrobium sp.]|jgi:nucleoside-diphosphate-sugar epimerase